MRRRPLALAAVCGLGAVLVLGTPASASDPVGTLNISNQADQRIRAVTLSPGRVTWANTRPAKTPVTTRSVTVSGSGLTLGPGDFVGYAEPKTSGSSYTDTFRGLTTSAASGIRTTWAAETSAGFFEGGYSDPDTIVYGARLSQKSNDGVHTATIRAFASPSLARTVSGARVLYLAGPWATPKLYNLRTGGTASAATAAGTALYNPHVHNDYDAKDPVALWGDSLAFVAADGSVWRNTLSDPAAAIQLAPVVAPADGYVHGASVYAWGDWVAWNRQIWKDDALVAEDCQMRNARTMAPAVDLAACPTGLTSAGVIGQDAATQAWYLNAYDGTAVPLPVPSTATEVTIDGPLMAWVRNGGVGRITPFDGPTAQPRSLGAPIAKAGYVRGGPSWGFDLISSAALAHCAVAITKPGGAVIRTLPCDSLRMRTGEAVVRWDGRNGAGTKVPAATYGWTVTASDADGRDLLRASGAAGSVSGTVVVS